MAKRNPIIGVLDGAGITALALTATGLFVRPFSDSAALSGYLLSLCLAGLCVGSLALVLSRIIEITAHTIHQQRVGGRRARSAVKPATANAPRDPKASERDAHTATR